jgi:hypothetical protein
MKGSCGQPLGDVISYWGMQEAVQRCTFVRLSGPVIVSRDANSLG